MIGKARHYRGGHSKFTSVLEGHIVRGSQAKQKRELNIGCRGLIEITIAWTQTLKTFQNQPGIDFASGYRLKI
ncbi:hypothetical protein ASD31_24920 [Rhizobium sp. Root482]|nr:hypothetical protein ASD31_24920 [Rhizobium sp. Root482]